MSRSPLRPLALAAFAAVLLAACAAPSSAPTAPAGTDGAGSPATSPAASDAALDCSPQALPLLSPGTLTISTSKPAYPPYVMDEDPTTGEGFESAVAYAVADKLGFTHDQVRWTFVTFGRRTRQGAKTYDFGLQQVSSHAQAREGDQLLRPVLHRQPGRPGAEEGHGGDLRDLGRGPQGPQSWVCRSAPRPA